MNENILLSRIVELMFNLRTFSQVLATVIEIFYFDVAFCILKNVSEFSECGMKNLSIKLFYNLFMQTKKNELTQQICKIQIYKKIV